MTSEPSASSKTPRFSSYMGDALHAGERTRPTQRNSLRRDGKVRPLQPKARTAETRPRHGGRGRSCRPSPAAAAGAPSLCARLLLGQPWGTGGGKSAAWKPSRQMSLLHSHLQDAERRTPLQTDPRSGEPDGRRCVLMSLKCLS